MLYEALRAALRAGQSHVGDGAGNAAVAVLERMDRHEPEVRQARLQHRVGLGRRFEPVQERTHLRVEPGGGRRFEMHPLAADGTGDYLHRVGLLVAPSPDRDSPHLAAAGREQRRVPVVQSVCGKWLVVAPRRVEHHLDDALDVAIGPPESADVHAEATRDRRLHFRRIERLPLDVAALHHVLDQRPEHRLALQIEAEGLHSAEKATLPVPDLGQRVGQHLGAPVEPRPVGLFVDVQSPHD
jgi:hypothetical protein